MKFYGASAGMVRGGCPNLGGWDIVPKLSSLKANLILAIEFPGYYVRMV